MDKAEALMLWIPVNLLIVLFLFAVIVSFPQGILYSLLTAFIAGPPILGIAIVYYRGFFKAFKKNS